VAADTPIRRRPGRRPKQLGAEPALFEPARGGAGGLILVGRGSGRAGPPRGGSGAPGTTAEPAGLVSPPAAGADPEVRAAARRIAARLSLPRPRREARRPRGAGELLSLPYRGGADEIDLDRTLEVLAERPYPDDEDVIVREPVRTRRAVVLAVDVSGSMRGERVRTAAAAVGALAGELARDDLAVVAFWSDAALLHRLGEPVRPQRLLEALLGLPARGLTNVAFPLEVAAREFGRRPARDARVLVLSDCVHNAGPDPRALAGRLPRVDVLLDVAGEHDLELGRDLARIGRGRVRRVRGHRDVAPALAQVFAP
jgi:Mg-chelatase subunit ChlD